MQDPNEDTEWNDVLRAKGIIPEKPKDNEITEEALTEMKQGAQAEAFNEVWEAYREERRNGEAPMWSVEDATAFVLKSKEAHADREVACVAILPGEPHRIVTFSVPIAFLTNPSE